jgi:hypothetical protein
MGHPFNVGGSARIIGTAGGTPNRHPAAEIPPALTGFPLAKLLAAM